MEKFIKKLTQPQIGLLIRDLRQEMDLTQEEFATHFGVVFSTVNRWEKGHNKPSSLALKVIQNKLEAMGKKGEHLLQRYQV
ncbi:DNA-binding transcriptional regulator [Myxosarcina sp. GI1]|uniref:helix-turn-helix domain-containing protein n=1 Tax=Myxosarcina sp. GI1 TaxID=1541065 RepID=UPI000565E7A6|nr:helix-turn-helix domain-containing protein [Myxosarcina sp. GI1]